MPLRVAFWNDCRNTLLERVRTNLRFGDIFCDVPVDKPDVPIREVEPAVIMRRSNDGDAATA